MMTSAMWNYVINWDLVHATFLSSDQQSLIPLSRCMLTFRDLLDNSLLWRGKITLFVFFFHLQMARVIGKGNPMERISIFELDLTLILSFAFFIPYIQIYRILIRGFGQMFERWIEGEV